LKASETVVATESYAALSVEHPVKPKLTTRAMVLNLMKRDMSFPLWMQIKKTS
jgi:hypothetical protein